MEALSLTLGNKKRLRCVSIESATFSQERKRGWDERWFQGVGGWGCGCKIMGKDGWGQEGTSAWRRAERHDGSE